MGDGWIDGDDSNGVTRPVFRGAMGAAAPGPAVLRGPQFREV